jgi:hypothetical protein
MGTDVPTPTLLPIHCAPRKAPCPKCGKLGKRARKLPARRVRTAIYKEVAYLEITCGEYRAQCSCSKTFRSSPEQVLPRALYDNKVRELVLERILADGMNVEQTIRSLEREFLLELSPGFIYDVIYDKTRQLDMAEHRRKVLDLFSGTLCIDELHLGRNILLLATDPLMDIPVAFALVDQNDQNHMGRFLRNLAKTGLAPRVVVTDGSNLYPALLKEIWKDAVHQLCVFHVIKDINKLILEGVRRLRAVMSRRGNSGRKKKRGRKGAKSRVTSRSMTLKDKAYFVFKRRFLIVKRKENLTKTEQEDLILMLEYMPELVTLRRFSDRIYWLFDTPKNLHQASCRLSVLMRDAKFQSVPELAKALKQLDGEKFMKMMAYLGDPVNKRVRTNNHVERANRVIRYMEKVKYKWRRRKTLVRFIVLKLDRIWKKLRSPNDSGEAGQSKTSKRTQDMINPQLQPT